MNTNKFRLIDIPQHGDERGSMCVAECNDTIPFVVHRVFYDYNNVPSSEKRGNHANRESKFFIICVKGSCTINVDDGFNKKTFVLDDPSKGLYLESMVWKEMYNYSQDSVLMIFSDSKYDKNEYIRNYENFIREVGDTK